MRIILLANHAGVLPVMDYFYTQGWLKAVVSTDKLASHNLQIEDYCKIKVITHLKVRKEQLLTDVSQLFKDIQPDLAIMFGFTYRIPKVIYTIPRLGFYNIHYSLLPAYRGSDPIFWQLKNGEQTGGITIHEVNEDFDTGKVIMQQPIPFIRGENWGICNSRYTPVATEMILNLVQTLKMESDFPEVQVNGNISSYYPKPNLEALTIKWQVFTSEQVEDLVNAANPAANGAITVLKQQMANILEVSPVDGLGVEHVKAGTIIHADGNGLFVQCADKKILRINIIKLSEGYLTGFKLAALGVKAGDAFET